MKKLALFLCISFSINASAQNKTNNPPRVYNYVEQMPEPRVDIGKYISENLTYPPQAAANNIEGRVIVKFVVDSLGKLEDVHVVKSIDPSLDSEAVRVISSMPDWKPAYVQGKPVNVFFTLPINFQLTDPTPKH